MSLVGSGAPVAGLLETDLAPNTVSNMLVYDEKLLLSMGVAAVD